MYAMENCRDQAEFFYSNLFSLIDKITPIETVKFKASYRPWVTTYFKNLVSSRDAAFVSGNTALFKSLRNRVNRIRKSLQTQYYLNKIDNLKTDNPAKWWKNLKQICRLDNKSDSCFENIQFQGKPSAVADLPEAINSFLVSITSDIPDLKTTSLTTLRNSLPQVPDKFIVSTFEVYQELEKIKVHKATGPDEIPNKILKKLSHILAEPICAIINSSIREGIVPDQWKIARITPLPKKFPPHTVENDIRPIAITNAIAKIATFH